MDISILIYVIAGIVIAVLGILAVKIVLKFDVNKWHERRDRKTSMRLQNTCPHMSVEYIDETNKFRVRSFFVTPSGTLAWICSQCGLSLPSELMIPEVPTDFAGIKAITDKQKKFVKIARKAGLV